MKSLGTRLALLLSSVLLILVLGAGVMIERQLRDAIYSEEVDQARVHAQTLLASLQILMLNGQGTLAREWLNRMHAAPGIVDIEVLRVDGVEAFSDLSTVQQVNEFLGMAKFQREPVPPHHITSPHTEAFIRALQGEIALDLRYPEEITVLQPIKSGAECQACHGYDTRPLRGVLLLSLSREQGLLRIDNMRTSLWWIAGLLVGVIALTVWLVLRVSVLKPVNRLKEAISRVGSGERNVDLPIHWRDELGQVAVVFNDMQSKLVANETRIRAVADNAFDAIITTNQKGDIETANHAVEKIFGYKLNELVGKNVSILMPEPYRKEHSGYIERYRVTGQGRLVDKRTELTGLRRNGSTFPMELALSEMIIDDQRHFVAIARDITESKRQTEALQYQAMHDALTELPNRSLLSDRVRQGILQAQREHHTMSLLVMDLDRFKEINDTLGHQYGDGVLRQVSARIRDALRESDTVARLGGDEFAVLLPNTNVKQAECLADKLLEAIDKPFDVDSQVLHVGVSIGIAMYPQHGEDEVILMQRADVAMYVAKRGHHGQAVYDPENDRHSLRNLTLLGELRGAIERDELQLYFQPKIDMRTNKICGVESLIRWQHPEHGFMNPDEFIPIAEQTGLIGPLSLWVLSAALGACQACSKLGVAVNLSVRNLQDIHFPDKIKALIDRHGSAPGQLTLEITETAIMSNPERALAVLGKLSDMGIKLSIDDFGTGYSSLAHLKQMPVNELKIDKSFVLSMLDDESDEMIVRSIIDLSHNIGIRVVAEGVETEELYLKLKEMGCDVAQGHYIGRAMLLEELMGWVSQSEWR